MSKARSLFPSQLPATLDQDVRFVTAAREDLEIAYEDKPLSIARRERLAAADAVEVAQVESEPSPASRMAVDAAYAAAQQHAARMGEAFRSLQVMGQILKNFPGSLTGEVKLRLAQECYNLGLRTLGSVLAILDAGRDSLLDAYAGLVREGHPSFLPEEVRRRARLSLFGLTHAICYGMVQRVSLSVGGPDLTATYKRVREANPSVATSLIDISLRMEQIQTVFPRHEVVKLGEEIENKPVSTAVLRHLVVNHFYLFPVDITIKQAVCAKLGISFKRMQAPDPKRRLIKGGG